MHHCKTLCYTNDALRKDDRRFVVLVGGGIEFCYYETNCCFSRKRHTVMAQLTPRELAV